MKTPAPTLSRLGVKFGDELRQYAPLIILIGLAIALASATRRRAAGAVLAALYVVGLATTWSITPNVGPPLVVTDPAPIGLDRETWLYR